MTARDWAFRKVEISEKQQYVVNYAVAHNGDIPLTGVGVDFGGWSAFHSIMTGLIRKGVLLREERGWRLVKGEPVKYEEPKLKKPCIIVRRQLMSLYDGERMTTQNAVIWLDPRGDATFHVVLDSSLAGVGSAIKDDPRIALRDGVCVSRGATLIEAVERATALSKEYEALTKANVEEVILVSMSTETRRATGLSMEYRCLLKIGGDLYERGPTGGIRHSDNVVRATSGEGKALIHHTPEREATLEALRLNIATLAERLKKLISEEDFGTIVDQRGHKLLELK
jgi:hypothetical protein